MTPAFKPAVKQTQMTLPVVTDAGSGCTQEKFGYPQVQRNWRTCSESFNLADSWKTSVKLCTRSDPVCF